MPEPHDGPRTAAEHALAAGLLTCDAAARATGDLRQEGYAYANPFDFLRQHGRWYPPMPLPRGVRRGERHMCYGNALLCAALRDLTYVEGYASLRLRDQRVAMFLHAWVTDGDGRLYELTWPSPGLAYCGVAFSLERADEATWRGDACILDDHHRGWPLLRSPWRGEPVLTRWPDSPYLTLVRQGRLREAYAWVREHRHDPTG
jgi:hypothetical protein